MSKVSSASWDRSFNHFVVGLAETLKGGGPIELLGIGLAFLQVSSALTASIEVLLHAPYYTYDARLSLRVLKSLCRFQVVGFRSFRQTAL